MAFRRRRFGKLRRLLRNRRRIVRRRSRHSRFLRRFIGTRR